MTAPVYPPKSPNETFQRSELLDVHCPPQYVMDNSEEPDREPTVAIFENHGLLVKWSKIYHEYGKNVGTVEGQCLRFLAQNTDLPVPETYRWRTYEGFVFLYMELINAPSVKDVWADLKDDDLRVICQDLYRKLEVLQSLDPQWSQSVESKDDLRSRVYPFRGLEDCLFYRLWRDAIAIDKSTGKGDDNPPYVFTYPDIHYGNVLITKNGDGSWRIVSIVDFEGAGWYPRYFGRAMGLDGLAEGKFT